MPDLLDDINELFSEADPPQDDGATIAQVRPGLSPLHPDLVFLAYSGGTLICWHGEQRSRQEPVDAARRLAESLCGSPDTPIVISPHGETDHSLVGLRIEEGNAFLGFLGIIGAAGDIDVVHDADWAARAGTFARLVWDVIHADRQLKVQRIRNEQLLAEQETLKQAHADVLESNLQEKEERLREKHEHIQHLESEVQKRSAALQEAMEKAEQASQSKSEFLANMSHEIRTPMTAILGFAENLLEPNLSEAERQGAIRTILRNGEYLIDIINDILDISKIEAGKVKIETIRCSPAQILADVQSLMRVRADAKGLSLHFETVGLIPETIHTDPTRLRQILINLIGNAIKFTETGGIRVLTRLVSPEPDSPTLQFDIIDTGIGMTPEQAARIFRPFAQADSSTTRRFGGTGLGLTISKRLAEFLGGGIALADTQPGCGTRFRVTIGTGSLEGVRMVDRPTDAVRSNRTSEAGGKRQIRLDCRILLAEDGPDNQRLISFVLRKAGAQVDLAENGKIAVEKAIAATPHRRASDPTGPYDVILMDMQMPKLDGYGATKLLREKGHHLPIIALTAHAMAGDRQKCLDAGCNDYATKPIDRHKLLETIASHLPAGKYTEITS